MKIGEIIKKLEEWAPPSYQESYDNSGLIVGNQQTEVSGVLICLDSVEETIDEALEKGCNLVIAHHPILFRGIKSLTGRNYVERTLIKAIQNNVAIYAIHTNLDNIDEGVNQKIGELMGIENSNILVPKTGILQKLATYCPLDKADTIKNALFQAGAGKLGNYDSCSFNTNGEGSYRPLDGSNPYAGQSGELHREAETKVEVVFPKPNQSAVVNALLQSHPYEEVAYEIYETLNEHRYVGSGKFGELKEAMPLEAFLKMLKEQFKLSIIRHTGELNKSVKKIAWCGGSGSFLLGAAQGVGADVFVTSDFKYHEFFDHENKVIIADIGHYESEQFTVELIADFLKENFNKFAVHLTGHNSNPVKYY